MKNIYSRIENLGKRSVGYWAERVIGELKYAYRLSRVKNNEFDSVITKTVEYLENVIRIDDAITKKSAIEAEKMLMPLSAAAKEFNLICVAHAHIDMNWMWGFHETAAITLDTFRTMLNLMNEYPDFKFSQSQASVYKIVETYDSDMLEDIKKRVKEGRWEVTATTWVENDKNMPNGESLARHILYTKQYLSELLDIDPESLKIDFQPDTFGHNRNVPEILANAGIDYYYHCRGAAGECIYNWEAPSGSRVLVFRDYKFYNGKINEDMVLNVPDFCAEYGIKTDLKLYGVGDHGGGPTRKDIEKLIDMAGWPVYPSIRFGTLREFFDILSLNRESFPTVKGELNFIFPGCYTTQTRIKLANKTSEAKLYESEVLSALSTLYGGGRYRNEAFGEAWQKTLFNQFHDILPGSGVIDTREYAMSLFQQTITTANTEAGKAMRALSSLIDTTSLQVDNDINNNNTDSILSESEGAGVGYAIKDYAFPQAERGKGRNRIYHFFNPLPYAREENARLTVWDWPGDISKLAIKSSDGRILKHQVIDAAEGNTNTSFWGHKYFTVLVKVKVPAFGYATCTLGEEDNEPKFVRRNHIVIEPTEEYVLENEQIRAEFDPADGALLSLIDKRSGIEMLRGKEKPAVFRYIKEDDARGMTAWIVGRYMEITDINKNAKIKGIVKGRGLLCQYFRYELAFNNSTMSVMVSLDDDSSFLKYDVTCDWQERPVKGEYMPQLNFSVPFSYSCDKFRYDIPFGTIDRSGLPHDVPANSWAAPIPSKTGINRGIMLVSADKYGFRGISNSISLTLIRSSYNPDPYPDLGIHKFRFALGVTEFESNRKLIEKGLELYHPFSFISGTYHSGNLEADRRLLEVEEGNVIVSSVKMTEKDNEKTLAVRLYETEGNDSTCRIKLTMPIKTAYFADITEKKKDTSQDVTIDPGESSITFNIKASSIATLCIAC